MNKIYRAEGNKVFANDEHFITVHITEPVISNVITVEKQAELLAELLNDTDE